MTATVMHNKVKDSARPCVGLQRCCTLQERPARVVNVSSTMADTCTLNMADPQLTKPGAWSGVRAYSQSKLCQVCQLSHVQMSSAKRVWGLCLFTCVCSLELCSRPVTPPKLVSGQGHSVCRCNCHPSCAAQMKYTTAESAARQYIYQYCILNVACWFTEHCFAAMPFQNSCLQGLNVHLPPELSCLSIFKLRLPMAGVCLFCFLQQA